MNTITTQLTSNATQPISEPNHLKQNILSLLLTPNSYFSKKITNLFYTAENVKWKTLLKNVGAPKADEILTYTSSRELRALYEIASSCSKDAVALEIGSHLGASSCYIAAGLSKVNGHLFCVDSWQNETMPEGEQNTFSDFRKNIHGLREYITPVRKMSNDVSNKDVKVPLNLVFIDGDHSYEAVKSDFELVQKWIAKDGIIAFHDFSNSDYEGVTRVVGEALASVDWKLAGYVDTLVWIKPASWTRPIWVK